MIKPGTDGSLYSVLEQLSLYMITHRLLKLFIIWGIIAFSFPLEALAFGPDSTHIFQLDAPDTLRLQAGEYFFKNDSLVALKKDTLILESSEAITTQKKDGAVFYDKLNKLSKKNVVARELYNLTFVQPKPQAENDLDFAQSEQKYAPFTGLIIRNIHIRKLDIIGSSVYDTSLKTQSAFGGFANRSHVYTRDFILHNNLLVAPNDTVNPWLLADNVKIIRDLPYIDNVIIYLHPIGNDSVDLEYAVKDKIAIGFLPVIYSGSKQSLRLWNSNFLGFGRQLGAGITHEKGNKPAFYLSDLNLSVNNLGRLFINNNIYYKRSSTEESYGFFSKREFIPEVVNLAGGVVFEHRWYQIPLTLLRPPEGREDARYIEGNAWVGHQFKMHQPNEKTKRPDYLIPSLGVYNKYFLDRPYVAADSNRFLSNNSALFAGLTLVSQNYIQTGFLLDQGVEVDLPYGYCVSLFSGYTFNEFQSSPYFSFDFKVARPIDKYGYVSGQFAIGAHLYDQSFNQGVFRVSLQYASPIFNIRNIPYRLIFSSKFVDGINRYTEDSLYLRDNQGIVGLNTNQLRGTIKASGMLQAVFYSPWRMIGFSMTPYMFITSGVIGDDLQRISRQRLVNGIGLGLRLRNEFLVFKSIQLRLVYYPYVPDNTPHISFDLNEADDIDGFTLQNWTPNYLEFK